MNVTKDGFSLFSNIRNVLEYRTLMFLLENTNEDGVCELKQTEIAKSLNTHRQAINLSLSGLEDKNIISVEKQGIKRIYHINPEYCVTSIGYTHLKKEFDRFKKQ